MRTTVKNVFFILKKEKREKVFWTGEEATNVTTGKIIYRAVH
jgi:hypothetical protein